MTNQLKNDFFFLWTETFIPETFDLDIKMGHRSKHTSSDSLTVCVFDLSKFTTFLTMFYDSADGTTKCKSHNKNCLSIFKCGIL